MLHDVLWIQVFTCLMIRANERSESHVLHHAPQHTETKSTEVAKLDFPTHLPHGHKRLSFEDVFHLNVLLLISCDRDIGSVRVRDLL